MEGLLIETADAVNIQLSQPQIKKFISYYNLLTEWNNKINLTAITDFGDVVKKHFIDSLAASKYISNGQTLIDIGSGAGFPGVPLKIYNESLAVTLLDSLNKRIIFLDEVIKGLNLTNTKAVHLRAEDAACEKQFRQSFDVVCSRAVAKLNILCEYCLPFVKLGGKFIAYKGREDETDTAKKAIKILGGEIEKIDEFNLFDFSRKLIVIKKVKNTPLEFPRQSAKIKLKPL